MLFSTSFLLCSMYHILITQSPSRLRLFRNITAYINAGYIYIYIYKLKNRASWTTRLARSRSPIIQTNTSPSSVITCYYLKRTRGPQLRRSTVSHCCLFSSPNFSCTSCFTMAAISWKLLSCSLRARASFGSHILPLFPA